MEEVKKHKTLFILLLLLYIFNVHDLSWTYHLVLSGMAEEINPAMKFLLDINPLFFVLLKIHLMMVVIFIIWKYRGRKSSFIAASISTTLYGILTLYQVCCTIYLLIYL